MKKIVVTYTKTPTNYNDPRCLVVEAASPEDAVKIVKDHLRDLSGRYEYVYETRDYVPPPAGKVLGPVGPAY